METNLQLSKHIAYCILVSVCLSNNMQPLGFFSFDKYHLTTPPPPSLSRHFSPETYMISPSVFLEERGSGQLG